MLDQKCCYRCQSVKPFDDFYQSKSNKSGYCSMCKICDGLSAKERYLKRKLNGKILPYDPIKDKFKKIKYKYNLSEKEYNDLKDLQKDSCAICSTKTDKLVVDHCHATNLTRGLLCQKCNYALGFFKDSQEFIFLAQEYLKTNYSMNNAKLQIYHILKTKLSNLYKEFKNQLESIDKQIIQKEREIYDTTNS